MQKTKAPKWLPAKFESLEKVAEISRRVISSLPVAVRAKLEQCSAIAPCLSDACPPCLYRFRLRLLKAARKSGFGAGVWTRVSIILDTEIKPGELATLDTRRLVERIEKGLNRHLPGTLVIGGIDFSFNIFAGHERGWQPHAYFLVNLPHTSDLEIATRKAVRSRSPARRHVVFKEVKAGDFLKCLSYSYKREFYTRSTYFEQRERMSGERRLNSRPQALKAEQLEEISLALLPLRVGARLILTGAKRSVSRRKLGKFSLRLKVPLVLRDTN
jgi:hypothetical protein